MTFNDAVEAIKPAVPTSASANAEVIATAHLNKSVLKVGRMWGVSFNEKAKTFNLTAGQSSYRVGADILTDFSDLMSIGSLWLTDRTGWECPVVPVQQFNNSARGSTSTGRPTLATIHSDTVQLEVWPTPDSAYEVWAMARKGITEFMDIPDRYHDTVIDDALASLAALRDPKVSIELASVGIDDIRNDKLTSWDGNTFPIERHIAGRLVGGKPDSSNLTGD